MRTLKGWIGHRDIQPTQRYADHCQNPGESNIVQSAFAAGTGPGTRLRAPQRTDQPKGLTMGRHDARSRRAAGSSPTPGAPFPAAPSGRRWPSGVTSAVVGSAASGT